MGDDKYDPALSPFAFFGKFSDRRTSLSLLVLSLKRSMLNFVVFVNFVMPMLS